MEGVTAMLSLIFGILEKNTTHYPPVGYSQYKMGLEYFPQA